MGYRAHHWRWKSNDVCGSLIGVASDPLKGAAPMSRRLELGVPL